MSAFPGKPTLCPPVAAALGLLYYHLVSPFAARWMGRKSSFVRIASICMASACATGTLPAAHTERPSAPYPSKPLVILEPFGAGGGPDLLARALAGQLSELLHQKVVVQNVVGSGATAAPAQAAKLPADGYTLLINTNAQAYSKAARADLSYDPIRDFIPLRTLSKQPYVLVTGKGSGVHSIADLIALAKRRPGTLTFGSTGLGTGTHIAGAELSIQAGLFARHVAPGPTEGINDVLIDAASDKFTYCFAPITLVLPAIRVGELVPLGTSTNTRSRLLPSVPTIAEAGVPTFDFPLWYGIWVRSRTSAFRAAKLDRAIETAVSSPVMRKWLEEHGAEPLNLSRDPFDALMRRDCRKAARILGTNRC